MADKRHGSSPKRMKLGSKSAYPPGWKDNLVRKTNAAVNRDAIAAQRLQDEEDASAVLQHCQFAEYRTLDTSTGRADPSGRSADDELFRRLGGPVVDMYDATTDPDFDREMLLELYRCMVQKIYLLHYISKEVDKDNRPLRMDSARELSLYEAGRETARVREVFREHPDGKSKVLDLLRVKVGRFNQLYMESPDWIQIQFIGGH